MKGSNIHELDKLLYSEVICGVQCENQEFQEKYEYCVLSQKRGTSYT